MAVREQLILDLSQALSQIDQLERELDGLFQPIVIPVDVETDAALGQLQRDINAVDNDAIDIDVNAAGVENAERSIGRLGDEFDDAEDSAEDYARAVDRADKETDQLGRTGTTAFGGLKTSLVGLTAAVGGLVALRGLGQFFGDAIQSASDLEESTSKAQVVFGDFFDDIQEFASTAPAALGLANSEALEFTGTFGNLFTALGLSQDAASDLAPEIVQLGADLASFNNIEVTDALEKLRSGLVGEAEPLRTLGVNINAATTEAKALELGLVGVDGAVSDAAKVQARYALILEQTTTAQGDFARTSDGIANTQRSLGAEFENLKAKVGDALVPAFGELLESAERLIPTLESLTPVIGLAGEVAAGFVTSLKPAADLLGLLVQPIDDINQALESTGDVNTDGLDRLSDSARNLFENTDAALPLLEELIRLLGTGLDASQLRDEFTKLNDLLDAGVDPAEAAADAIRAIGEAGTVTDEVLQAIIDTTKLAEGGIGDLLAIARSGDLGELTPDELQRVLDLLRELADVGARGEGLDFSRGRAGIRDLGDDAEAAIPKVFGFTGAVATLGNLDPNFDLEFNIDDEIAALERQFDRLPTAFDAAKASLKGSEGEAVDDFGTFTDNLIAELENQANFISNIDLLRTLGFDDLADKFLDLGVESADLLADGIADPGALARAESALDQYAAGIDQKLRGSTIDSVSAAVASVDELIVALNSLEDVSISASVFLSLTGPGAKFAGSFGVGSTGTSELVNGNPVTTNPTNVTINNNGILPSDTESARTAQQVNAITSNAR